jgi:hypothetical protein
MDRDAKRVSTGRIPRFVFRQGRKVQILHPSFKLCMAHPVRMVVKDRDYNEPIREQLNEEKSLYFVSLEADLILIQSESIIPPVYRVIHR